MDAIVVVVLGDLGRSPRMQYHALAIADEGVRVRLVGLEGTECVPEVLAHPRIEVRRLRDRLARPGGGFRAVRALARLAVQHLQLLGTLFGSAGFRAIVVQSPPALPTLGVSWLVARLRGARWIVDWHNFSHSILAASLGDDHAIARGVRACERWLGRRADAHLCVSQAMADQLEDNFGIRDAAVLYDRPAKRFAPLAANARPARRQALLDRYLPDRLDRESADRCACLVCPTSWSDDDDIDLLLDALIGLDERLDEHVDRSEPAVWVWLTGRGPNRAHFESRIRRLALRHVRIDTLWVSAADYPQLLACADLGICVHRSASGVDLPMKVADLIGAGVPVCALDYGPCLAEQLNDGDGALLFADSDTLTRQLFELLADFPDKTTGLDGLREAVVRTRSRTPAWRDDWAAIARPLLIRDPASALRIAFFHPDLGVGGAERWLVDAALALQRAGHQITVITSRFDPRHCFEAARDGQLSVQVRGRWWPAHFGGRLRAPCAIARSAIAVVSTALRGERFDLVCVDLVPHVVPLLASLGRPNVLYYCHHPDQLMARHLRAPTRPYDAYRAPIDALERRGARSADRVLVNSRFTGSAVERVYGLDASAIEVLHPGIAVDTEPTRTPESSAILLLCIGRFDPGKRFERAIEATGRVVERADPSLARRIELVIAGGYDAEQPDCARTFDALERAAREAGIRDHVKLVRSPTDTALRDLLERCRCLIHPTSDEHFGIVPLEAMAAGRAIVAARSGGLTETVVDGETGLLCDPTADALADAIGRLVHDPELAHELGRAGRERAVADFSVDAFGAQLCAVVSELASGAVAGTRA